MTDTDRTLHGEDEIDLNDDDDLDAMVEQAEAMRVAENNVMMEDGNNSTIADEERDLQRNQPYHSSVSPDPARSQLPVSWGENK